MSKQEIIDKLILYDGSGVWTNTYRLDNPVVVNGKMYTDLYYILSDGIPVGYKAFRLSEDGLRCKDMHYELGQVNEYKDHKNRGIEMCLRGLHFSPNPESTYSYYTQYDDDDIYDNPIILLVIPVGDVLLSKEDNLSIDKYCTDKLYVTPFMVDTRKVINKIMMRFDQYIDESPYKYKYNRDRLLNIANNRLFTIDNNESLNYKHHIVTKSKLNKLTDTRTKLIQEYRYRYEGMHRLEDSVITNLGVSTYDSVRRISNYKDLVELVKLGNVVDPDELIRGHMLDMDAIYSKYQNGDTTTKSSINKVMSKLIKLLSSCRYNHNFFISWSNHNEYITDKSWSKLINDDELMIRFTHTQELFTDRNYDIESYYSNTAYDTDINQDGDGTEYEIIYSGSSIEIDKLIESLDPVEGRVNEYRIKDITDEQMLRLIDKVGIYNALNQLTNYPIDKKLKTFKMIISTGNYDMELASILDSFKGIKELLDNNINYTDSAYKLVLITKSIKLYNKFKDQIVDEVGDSKELYKFITKDEND